MARIVHFEIHADNPERAVRFYENTLDWNFEKWEGPQDYWLITTGDPDEPGINGGLMRRQHTIDGQAVIAYVCTADVDSVDDTTQKVKDNGGSIAHSKVAIPGMGWLVYFKDTEGNIFGAMQSDPNAR